MADPPLVAGESRVRLLRVFLCHASRDKPEVRKLYHRLTEDGFQPWLDEEDLLPGHEWEREIPRAVRASDVLLVCLSHQAINKEGYLQKEIRIGLDAADEKPEGTIFLIPLKLEECSIPQRFQRWQWVNLFEVNGYERLLRALNERSRSLGLGVRSASNRQINSMGLSSKPQQAMEQMRAGYAWLTEIRDSLGNRNVHSFGKGTGGDWSNPVITTVQPGDEIVLHAESACPIDCPLEYRFSVQRSGMGFSTRRDWSTVCEWTWNVTDNDIGQGVVAMISVQRPKSYYQLSDADDYTYAIYDVLPNLSIRRY